MVQVVSQVAPSMSFSNVGRNRDGTATHLGGKTIDLPSRKGFGYFTDPNSQIHGPLPHDEILIAFHDGGLDTMDHPSRPQSEPQYLENVGNPGTEITHARLNSCTTWHPTPGTRHL